MVAGTTTVVTPQTLDAAFASAKAGDTLKLVGTFGAEWLANRSFNGLLTIDATAAKFTDKFQLENVSNVVFVGGSFDLSNDPAWTKGILIDGGKNVYVDRINVVGSGSQWGVSVVGTANAQISDSTFAHLNSSILFGSVSSGAIGHNTITAAETDGIDIADSHFVTAGSNSCSAGAPDPGVHPDCIQLWSVAGRPLQSDNVIVNNRATGPTQGFTSFDDGGGALRLSFIGNTVNTSYSQGIACYECVNSTIANNKVSTLPGSQFTTEINIIDGTNNLVYGNTVTPYTPAPNGKLGGVVDLSEETGNVTSHDMLTDMILADDGTDAVASVPEPSSWALLIVGFAAVGLARRSRPGSAAGRRNARMA